MYELGEKVLVLPLAPARRGDCGARFEYGESTWAADHSTARPTLETPSEVIRCGTVRQLSVEERWDRKSREPRGLFTVRVNIRVDLPEARGDRGAHPPDREPPFLTRRMRLTKEMFERFGLTTKCLSCCAIRTGVGHPANH